MFFQIALETILLQQSVISSLYVCMAIKHIIVLWLLQIKSVWFGLDNCKSGMPIANLNSKACVWVVFAL